MMPTTTAKSLVTSCAVVMLAMVGSTTTSPICAVDGFSPQLSQKAQSSVSATASTSSLLTSSRPSSSLSSSAVDDPEEKPAFRNIAEFEYQELNIQLNAMKEQKVASSQLPLATRQEFEGYIRRIVNKRYSKSVPLNEIASKTKEDAGTIGTSLINTKWNLLFSTQSVVDESLPIDTTISIQFVSPTKLEYTLNFGKKILGLNQLTAISSYEFDIGPVNPGLLTFNYEDITTNMFGMKKMGLGMFGGFLSGRSNYVPTVYMDNKLWIEQGIDNVSGYEYFNVYVKEDSEGSTSMTSSQDDTPAGISMTGQWDD